MLRKSISAHYSSCVDVYALTNTVFSSFRVQGTPSPSLECPGVRPPADYTVDAKAAKALEYNKKHFLPFFKLVSMLNTVHKDTIRSETAQKTLLSGFRKPRNPTRHFRKPDLMTIVLEGLSLWSSTVASEFAKSPLFSAPKHNALKSIVSSSTLQQQLHLQFIAAISNCCAYSLKSKGNCELFVTLKCQPIHRQQLKDAYVPLKALTLPKS